jgi:hypothetical protein
VGKPYLAPLLDITINIQTLSRDWEKSIVVPIYKGDELSVVKNYRPVSLTLVVCKQMELVIAGYILVGQCGKIVIGYTRGNMASNQDTRVSDKYSLSRHSRFPT